MQLKAADGGRNLVLIGGEEALRLLATQLTADHQAPPQQRHTLIVVLRADHARAGNLRPAPGGDDRLVALNRPLQRLKHGFAAHRRGVGTQVVDRLGPPAHVLASVLVGARLGAAEPRKRLPPPGLRALGAGDAGGRRQH